MHLPIKTAILLATLIASTSSFAVLEVNSGEATLASEATTEPNPLLSNVIPRHAKALCYMAVPYGPISHVGGDEIIMCRLKTPVIAADGKTEIIEPGSIFYGEGFKGIIHWDRVISAHGVKAIFGLSFSNKSNPGSPISYSSVVSVVETPVSPLLPIAIDFLQDLDFSGFHNPIKNGD